MKQSVKINLGTCHRTKLVCYGRPSARGLSVSKLQTLSPAVAVWACLTSQRQTMPGLELGTCLQARCGEETKGTPLVWASSSHGSRSWLTRFRASHRFLHCRCCTCLVPPSITLNSQPERLILALFKSNIEHSATSTLSST